MSATEYNTLVHSIILIETKSTNITISYDSLTGDYIMNDGQYTHYFDCTEALIYFIEESIVYERDVRIKLCLPLDHSKPFLNGVYSEYAKENFLENVKKMLFLITHQRVKIEA